MTNATIPTLVKLTFGGTISTVYVDQFASIKGLVLNESSINGTHYTAFKDS